jgi:hypothetical protein
MTASKHIALVILFALAQVVFAAHVLDHAHEADHDHFNAHALEHADDADHKHDHDHDQQACQICVLAERQNDALPSARFLDAPAGKFTPKSGAFAKDVDTTTILRAPGSRAPPLQLNKA